MTGISMALLGGLALATAASQTSPLPEGASMARLSAPVDRPIEKLIDGRDWTCAGVICAADRQDTADSQPLWMECSDAAAELGAFSEYRTGPDTLDAAKLARCNTHARAAAK